MSYHAFGDNPDLNGLEPDTYERLVPLGSLIEQSHLEGHHQEACGCIESTCWTREHHGWPSTEEVLGWLVAKGLLDLAAAEALVAGPDAKPDYPPCSDEPADVPAVRCVRTGTVWTRTGKTWCDKAIWTDGTSEAIWYHLNKVDPMSEGFNAVPAAHVHTEACMCVMVPMDVEGASECHYCGVHGAYGKPCGDRCDIARAEAVARG